MVNTLKKRKKEWGKVGADGQKKNLSGEKELRRRGFFAVPFLLGEMNLIHQFVDNAGGSGSLSVHDLTAQIELHVLLYELSLVLNLVKFFFYEPRLLLDLMCCC